MYPYLIVGLMVAVPIAWVISSRLRDARREIDDTPTETVVVFTVPDAKLRSMDVATGPCVPLPGRKHPLRGVANQQGPERIEQMQALFVVLGGPEEEKHLALELIEESGPGRLFRCSDRFVELMANKNREQIELGEEDKANHDREFTKASAARDRLDTAWMAIGQWHKAQVGTQNRQFRMGWARIAQEKGQSLFCWYGPPVPQYVVIVGHGAFPGLSSPLPRRDSRQ